jgi:hypothetical protein
VKNNSLNIIFGSLDDLSKDIKKGMKEKKSSKFIGNEIRFENY